MAKKITTARQMKAQLIRQKLYDAAKSLVRQKGYENVTIDEICAEIGVTKGTFYNYFHSKEQMILDGIEEDNLYYRTRLHSKVAKLKPGLEKLFAFLKLAMDYESSKEKYVSRLFYRFRTSEPFKMPFAYPDKRELFRITELLIKEGQSCGEIRRDFSSGQLATMVLYGIRGIVYSWSLPDMDFDLAELSNGWFTVLEDGLRRKPADVSGKPAGGSRRRKTPNPK